MKNLKLSIALLLLMSTAFISVKGENPKKSFVSINKELTTLLIPTTEVGLLDKDEFVKVKIVITQNNEIVVLHTNSDNNELNNYIKSSLNYKKLTTNELEREMNYEFEIRFKA